MKERIKEDIILCIISYNRHINIGDLLYLIRLQLLCCIENKIFVITTGEKLQASTPTCKWIIFCNTQNLHTKLQYQLPERRDNYT
ncbi:hypothetical protein V1478_010221 [Vespula squamosa]|uniref:Uncharacterized protein n=1 Tax=Vespula squamosa TaxID=30214 RepID=A0ABD2AJC5_VESSQ